MRRPTLLEKVVAAGLIALGLFLFLDSASTMRVVVILGILYSIYLMIQVIMWAVHTIKSDKYKNHNK